MKKSGLIRFVPPAVFIGSVIFVWNLLSTLNIINEYILPSPVTVFNTFSALVSSGELFADVSISMIRVART